MVVIITTKTTAATTIESAFMCLGLSFYHPTESEEQPQNVGDLPKVTVNKWWRWNVSPGPSDTNVHAFPTVLHCLSTSLVSCHPLLDFCPFSLEKPVELLTLKAW